MTRVIIVIIEKRRVRNKILFRVKGISKKVIKKYPAPPMRMFRNRSARKYLYRGFKRDHLIKPFMAV